MNILERLNKKGDKVTFYYDFGRGPGQRPSPNIFIYTKPKNQIEGTLNKEALALIETKKSEKIFERQAIVSVYIPTHEFKANSLNIAKSMLTITSLLIIVICHVASRSSNCFYCVKGQ